MTQATTNSNRLNWCRNLCVWSLGLLLSTGVYAQITTASYTVNLDTDDQEEELNGALDIASSDLELAFEGGSVEQIIGIRFNNVDIPKGAIIKSAYIQFTCDDLNSGAATINFRGEASDSAHTFAQTPFAVSTRPKGTANTSWTIEPWTTLLERGDKQKSTDLKNIVQEIINRDGWKANNALAFIINGIGEREAESFEGAAGHGVPSYAPTLIVEYAMPTILSTYVNIDTDDQEEEMNGALDIASSDLELTFEGGSVEQLVGIRFNNLNIPQGAYITKAYIQFTCDDLNSGAATINFRGEASDSVHTFAQTNFSVSSRSTGSKYISWTIDPWTTIQERGDKQKSPDLKSVVQEIINRTGWKENNALAFIINGVGEREAESFEGAAGHGVPTYAPTLHIEYVTGIDPPSENNDPPLGAFPIPQNAIWKYLDNGIDQGTSWKDSTFNAGTWAFGPAELGYGDGGEATLVSYGPNSSNKYITTYFRHTFLVTADQIAKMDSLYLRIVRDDGAIIYLNGNEVIRSNMADGTVITSSTLALTNVSGSNESQFYVYTISKEHLVVGKNYLAVEIHQDAVTSSDMSFRMTMEGKRYNKLLIPEKSSWKYNDLGLDLGTSWKDNAFSDVSWNSGNGVLGYGNGDEATTLSYGDDVANKHITSYFRKTFAVTDTVGYPTLELKLKRDDGAVVFINGVEVFRNNIIPGSVTHQTPALTYIESPNEDAFITVYLNKTILTYGDNVIAVEIHQSAPTSTDVRFDLQLALSTEVIATTYTALNITCDPASSDLIGCFTSVKPTTQQSTFVFPSLTHTFQVLMKSQDSTYDKGAGLVPNGNDFTGFIPKNGSSTEGWLSVNHENSPGGVSIMDLHYNASSGLWVVDSINKVSFSGVVKTERNCSGGVTPWQTVITSEETYSNGDANSDGYTDIGWQVEIDPVTKKIKDYNNDGTPDKLWALGRMSHENIVLANDSITAYQAEDGGTGCVYKFVANQKMNLSAGTLYVLKRSTLDPTIGEWIVVPNSTQTECNTARDLAAALGGTNWGGCEDVEISPLDGRIYFTEKGQGNVWRFIDEGMTVSNIEALLSNTSYPIVYEGGNVTESWNTGNDNLDFDGEGNLWVMQDGGRDHLWMVKHDHTPANPKVELFGTSPTGSEPTGITFSPDKKFMFLSFQNAAGSNRTVIKDAAGKDITFNASTTIVISRKNNLGTGAVAPTVALGSDTTICEGNSLTLQVPAADILTIWNNNSTGNSIDITEAGEYSVRMIGNNGREAEDAIEVAVSQLPAPSLGSDVSICSTCSTVLDAGAGYASYLWSNNATTQSITVSASGTYSVTVKNEFECVGTDEIDVMLTSDVRGINNEVLSMHAAPNPFAGQTEIRFTLKQPIDMRLEISDVNGNKVATLSNGQMNSGEYVYEFTPSEFNLPSGVYILNATFGDRTSNIKLISY